MEDQRVDRKIDQVYSNKNPIQDITKIIEEEVRSTGLFEKFILFPEDQINNDGYLKENNVDLLMTSFLKKLEWKVPHYEGKVAGAFGAGFAGGLVGGFIYGSFTTDVYGDTVLKINLIDMNSGKSLIDKEYIAHYTERKTLMSCDTPKTKATVVGISLKMVMEEFKTDLIEAFGKRSNVEPK